MINALYKVGALLTANERRKAVAMLLMALLVAMAEAIGVISIMPFLSVVARPEIIEENPWLHSLYTHFKFSGHHQFIVALGLTSITLVISASLFKTIAQHLINRFTHFLRHSISNRLLERYLYQPYEFFLSRNSAELSKSILAEVDLLMSNFIQPLSQIVVQGIIVLTMLVVLFLYNTMMALAIVLIVSTLYAAIYGLIRKRLRRMGEEMQIVNKERYQTCNEALHGIRDIKITHTEPAYLKRYYDASRTQARHIAANDTLSQTPLYLVEATGYTGLIAITLVLLAQSNDIAKVLPALGLYGFAAYRMLPAAQIMYRGFARLRFSSAILDVLHRDMALPLPISTLDSNSRTLSPQKEIRLEGVCYAYPSTPDKPVLEDFNLVIPANTSIGIIGKSGAGKSTLMDILLGLLHPQTGSISVDNVLITQANANVWQRSIGYVPQHIYLSDASVAENIAFGVPNHEINIQSLERAARAAQIHDFVTTELPEGYDTKIGDRGIRLSGGQRQRIGIARALYRNPTVLFFDEATSALDSETEVALNDAIQNFYQDKTIVIINHKENSLSKCNEVITITSTQYSLPEKEQAP